MKNNNVHFSRNSDEWSTPRYFFDDLNSEFGPFTLDPAADEFNALTDKFYTKESNGLSKSWKDQRVFCNPPYSNLSEWIKKSSDERRSAKVIVLLIPARTDTKAFHQYIYKKRGVQIRFIKGRLKFSEAKWSAPFPSMIVIFKPI